MLQKGLASSLTWSLKSFVQPAVGSRRLMATGTDRRRIAIMGGGPVGMATAVHLGRLGLGKDVIVIERDSTYSKSSAMLSAGGIRQQFSLKENIELSMYSHSFIKEMEAQALQDPEKYCGVQFKPNGYLFMASTASGQNVLRTNARTQNDCGATWIKLEEDMRRVQQLFPWLHTEDLLAITYSKSGGGEGYLDPWALVQGMKREALSLGVSVVNGLVVGSRVQSAGGKHAVDRLTVRAAGGAEEEYLTSAVFNTAGAYAGKLTDLIANSVADSSARIEILRIPVKPRKRCIFAVHCPGKGAYGLPAPTSSAPLAVDPAGVYFRGEGSGHGNFICGVSPAEGADPDHEDDRALDLVDHDLFNEVIWPTLAQRVPAFNELKVTASWAGFYDYNTLDQNAIIGTHPQISNMIHCNGFSGHGLQMSPAAGRAAAEVLVSGKSTSIDLFGFGLERLATKTPYYETGIV